MGINRTDSDSHDEAYMCYGHIGLGCNTGLCLYGMIEDSQHLYGYWIFVPGLHVCQCVLVPLDRDCMMADIQEKQEMVYR